MDKSALVLLHDGNTAALRLGEMLSRMVPVTGLDVLDRDQPKISLGGGTVVCLGQATLKKFEIVRKSFGLSVEQSVFVAPVVSKEIAAIFRDMGVSTYFTAPVEPEMLWRAVSGARNGSVEASWQRLPPMRRDMLIASRQTFRKLFDGVRNGEQPDLADIEHTSKLICDVASDGSLSRWLSVIKDHHDYTFRHSMFVCGTIVYFGREVGVKGDDLTLLSMGGLLHDIGKARVPLRILDKPGPLDEAERLEMRKHPAFSRDILEKVDGLDRRIVTMAVHHHEKLDGTGYPDGLRGAAIDDLARLTAIADVYSALIDERAYKPAMTPEKAFAWMESTRGHIDLDVLRRFKEFVLGGGAAADLAAAGSLQAKLQPGE
jgi:putative nucleotidyltransferase with HDIG domain